MRIQREPFEQKSGAGEFFGFLVVALISAGAFLYVGSEPRPSVARVVSMEDTVGPRVASADEPVIDTMNTASIPLPTSRPD